MADADLIGRSRELSALVKMVGDDAVRLVSVTGPAGVGKTRVAYAAADAVARDRAWRVVAGAAGGAGRVAVGRRCDRGGGGRGRGGR